ncbi:MAG: hypothetical protein ACOC56_04090 [Atribacterota bacterium]
MRKKIKKYGNTAIIQLTVEDLENYGLKIGDIIKIDKIEVIKK